MVSYLDGSLLIRLIRYINNVYKSSSTYNILLTIKGWCSNSLINKSIIWYLERKSTAKYTVTYRLARSIFKKIDRVVAKIHSLIANYFGFSIISSIFQSFMKESKKNLNLLFITFFAAFVAGYGVINTIRGNWSNPEIVKTIGLVFITLVIALSINKWKLWLENSAIYKLYQYFWE